MPKHEDWRMAEDREMTIGMSTMFGVIDGAEAGATEELTAEEMLFALSQVDDLQLSSVAYEALQHRITRSGESND
jgi:hypothetical protein